VTDRQDELSRFEPVPQQVDVEAVLGWHTARRAIWVLPILAAAFWLFGGPDAALAAAVGVVIVAVNFWLAGVVLSRSARISLSLYHAAALFGFFLRLGLMVLTVLLIAQFVPIDRLAFGISAVVAYLVLLAWEAVAVSKGKERNLDWTR
jgi:uncharacterized membrane protein YqjE